MEMYLKKVISKNTFVDITDENSRIQIRIRIHTKISLIRNTDGKGTVEKRRRQWVKIGWRVRERRRVGV